MYPEPVQRMHDTIAALPGVRSVELGIQRIEETSVHALSLPGEFADLPHVAIRRTKGGLKDETLVTATIVFDPSREGWVALEFLAWWVRDQSRAGEQVQLRALALPPVGYATQLGRTLKFVVEWFFIDGSEDGEPILKKMGKLAESLASNRSDYEQALANPVDPDFSIETLHADDLRALAAEGNLEAQFELAQRLRRGDLGLANPVEAIGWYSTSAEKGYPPSMTFLGYCYANGIGINPDLKLAAKWYRQASDLGYPFAMGMLGQCYETGEGVRLDLAEAVRWYQRGADLGEASCQAQLGECYELGEGVQRDPQQALHWYRRALDQGFQAVQEAIERIEGQ
jgi:hypothetical protein